MPIEIRVGKKYTEIRNITIMPEAGGSRVILEDKLGWYASIKYPLTPLNAIRQQMSIIEKSAGKVKEEFLGILNGKKVRTWKV